MIQTLINIITTEIQRSLFAFIGGVMFFSSWLWQVYISKKSGKSKVDMLFWVLRFIGMSLVTIHTILIEEWVLTSMNLVGMVIYLYNIYLISKNEKKNTMDN